MTEENLKKLKIEGHRNITYIENKGWCSLLPFLFTVGLLVDITVDGGYNHRYCYPIKDTFQAVAALKTWEINSPAQNDHPQDRFWVKRKGENPLRNELYDEIKV